MKNKIIDLIVELICVIGIYILLMLLASKIGLLDNKTDIIATSIGFTIGWSIVRIPNIIHKNKKEKK